MSLTSPPPPGRSADIVIDVPDSAWLPASFAFEATAVSFMPDIESPASRSSERTIRRCGVSAGGRATAVVDPGELPDGGLPPDPVDMPFVVDGRGPPRASQTPSLREGGLHFGRGSCTSAL